MGVGGAGRRETVEDGGKQKRSPPPPLSRLLPPLSVQYVSTYCTPGRGGKHRHGSDPVGCGWRTKRTKNPKSCPCEA